MLITEQKPMDEILQYTDGEKNIFLVGCKGCADGCATGGEKQVAEMKQSMEKAGKTVTGTSLIDFVCNNRLTRMTLSAHEGKIRLSDSLVVLCCGAGVQATASVVDKAVHPGCNTLPLGGRHAEWREAEGCLECGQCVLEYTGGICPVTLCPKGLVNGPCGGTKDGKCEVDSTKDCAWTLIYNRLKKQDRLDVMRKTQKPKDYQKMTHPRRASVAA